MTENTADGGHEDDRRVALLGPADCLAAPGVEAAVRGWEAHRVEVGDDAKASIREAAELAGGGTLVTFGGDGSLHLAAQEILNGGYACTLGLVPDGTGNDFARHLGLSDLEPGEALERVLGWPARVIDTLRIPHPDGKPRRAVNAVSYGAAAETTRSTPEAVKAAAGKAAYAAWGAAFAAVASATRVKVTGDGPGGSFAWEGPSLGVIAGNGRFTGGGFHVTPRARLGSGSFEVLVVPELGVADRARLGSALRRTDGSDPAGIGDWPPEPLLAVTLTELRVEAEEPLALNCDGESSESGLLEVAIEPGKLRVRAPAAA